MRRRRRRRAWRPPHVPCTGSVISVRPPTLSATAGGGGTNTSVTHAGRLTINVLEGTNTSLTLVSELADKTT